MSQETKELIEKLENKPVKERTELFIRIVENLADIMDVKLRDIHKYSDHCPVCLRAFKKE